MMWLSFCDPDKPAGQQFSGACTVDGSDIVEAARNALELGINPGGEVMGVEIPEEPGPDYDRHVLHKNKLLSLQDLMDFGFVPVRAIDGRPA